MCKVDSGKVDSGKVDSGKVDSGKVDSGKIDSDKIDSDKIDSDKIDSDKIREITELEKIWKATELSFGAKYFIIPFQSFSQLLRIFMAILVVIAGAVFWIIFLIFTINSYSSGEGDFNYVLILFLLGIAVSFMSLVLFAHAYDLRGEAADERSLIRFKILALDIDLSAYNSNIIEALAQTLKSKGSLFSIKRYNIEELDPNQLTLAIEYLSKKHQIAVSLNDYLQLISLGILSNYEKPKNPEFMRCCFVMLDRKDSEVLLYSSGIQEWPYIREVLEEGGFVISDVSKTILDLELYEIKEDGTVTRRDKRRSYFRATLSNYF